MVEANVKLVGLMLTCGAGALTPVPLRLMTCGEPIASSTKVMEPVRRPRAVGVNVTVTPQLVKVLSAAPQVVVREKSPDAVIEVMLSVAVPLLVRVSACVDDGVEIT